MSNTFFPGHSTYSNNSVCRDIKNTYSEVWLNLFHCPTPRPYIKCEFLGNLLTHSKSQFVNLQTGVIIIPTSLGDFKE